MPCFRPLKGYQSRVVNAKTRKRSIVFTPREGYVDLPIDLPCGQCIGCRLERSRQWAIRCSHEASLHSSNCFITLTYNNTHLPSDGSLNLKHFQDFMKRLRFRFGNGIRFFHCGEYGDQLGRPHYHACLFNFDFGDKIFWKTRLGRNLYVSDALSELWPYGFSTIGEVTFESAAYVARYITKKVSGDTAEKHYNGRKAEYTTMSRRPGIGSGWFDKYRRDIYPSDFVVIREKKMKPPKYYDTLLGDMSRKTLARVKRKRKANAKERIKDEHYSRLGVKEQVQLLKAKKLIRSYEINET